MRSDNHTVTSSLCIAALSYNLFFVAVDDLIVLTEAVAYQMMQGNYDRALQSNVATMYSNLKLYGAQLEALYKDFLDRFVHRRQN